MTLAERVPSPEALAEQLGAQGYLTDAGLATALFLCDPVAATAAVGG